MKAISIFFVILAIYVATVFAKKAEMPALPEGFRIDTLANGAHLLFTPFAEVPVYASDLMGTSVIEKFVVIEWNSMQEILRVKTSEGGEARFSQINDDGEWYLAIYANGVLSSGKKITYVGLRMADIMAHFSLLAKAEVSITKGMIVVVGDDSTFLWEEEIPKEIKCKIIGNKWVLLSFSSGNFSSDSPFWRAESRYMAFQPNVIPNSDGTISPDWMYVIDDTCSGFSGTIAGNIGKFLK